MSFIGSTDHAIQKNTFTLQRFRSDCRENYLYNENCSQDRKHLLGSRRWKFSRMPPPRCQPQCLVHV